MKRILETIILSAAVLFASCSVSVPGSYTPIEAEPSLFPDYKNVTVPCNIAPLSFRIDEEGDDFVTRISFGDTEYVVGGTEVALPQEEWGELLSGATGDSIAVDVFVKKGEQWNSYSRFFFIVSPDSIDNYISYRLIPPSYVAYERLYICQRNITTYDESVIYSNMIVSAEPDGQCINCHAYKNYRTDNMQFHVRQNMGGTVFVHNGNVKKLDMKTDSTISAGVYPAFNPVYDLVAYSVNNTGQIFHTKNPNKVEVQDQASDVIVYNPVNETVTHVSNNPEDLEVFPTWSPDGRTLYYGSAHFPQKDSTVTRVTDMVPRYKEIKYDILSRSWNPETGEFGPVDTVFLASALGKSATFPRISPNGRYLLFALGEYGCFHIWHQDADLYVMDLYTKDYWPLVEANSNRPESYHSWSSNGKWILFASRREDTNYSRLYIAHVDENGVSDKAFLLPQESPSFYDFFDRSYNVPEFMVEPVRITPHEFAEVVEGPSVKVKYSTNVK
ncbi:MAG: hypothetical protein E7088_00655 [Bacteroidales bacterium]|nr:hypothetical protein [Bacteroidales bacterium]